MGGLKLFLLKQEFHLTLLDLLFAFSSLLDPLSLHRMWYLLLERNFTQDVLKARFQPPPHQHSIESPTTLARHEDSGIIHTTESNTL